MAVGSAVNSISTSAWKSASASFDPEADLSEPLVLQADNMPISNSISHCFEVEVKYFIIKVFVKGKTNGLEYCFLFILVSSQV